MDPGDDISAITPSATPVNAFLFGPDTWLWRTAVPHSAISRRFALQLLFSIRISQRERPRD